MEHIKPLIQKAADDRGICFAMDHGKRIHDFFAVNAHFINETVDGWTMMRIPIGFADCSNQSKTADKIIEDIQEMASEWGLNPYVISLNAAISDEGTNILKAVKRSFVVGKFFLYVI